jgi:hypothetical protein
MKAKRSDLRETFDTVVDGYIQRLLRMFEWDTSYGYWVSDDRTGVYAYGDDYFINLADIIYIVDNHVSKKDFEEWWNYGLWAHEFNQTIPNLASWVSGCPRVSKEEMDTLRGLKESLNKEIDKLNTLF